MFVRRQAETGEEKEALVVLSRVLDQENQLSRADECAWNAANHPQIVKGTGVPVKVSESRDGIGENGIIFTGSGKIADEGCSCRE